MNLDSSQKTSFKVNLRSFTSKLQVPSKPFYYTSLQSISKSDYKKIHQMALKFIQDVREMPTKSTEKKLVYFLVDFGQFAHLS